MDSISLLMIVAAGAAFYFLIIRPQRRRQREQEQLISSVAPGTRVMTSAGIFGTVVARDDDELSLEIAPGVVISLLPAAVARVIEPKAEPESEPQTESDTPPPVD